MLKSSFDIFSIDCFGIKKADTTNVAVAGTLKTKGLPDRHDTLFLEEPKHIAFRKPKIKLTKVRALDKSKKRFEVRIVSDAIIKALSLHIRSAKASFDDNCFDMAPSTERNIEVTLEKPLKLSQLRKKWQLMHYR